MMERRNQDPSLSLKEFEMELCAWGESLCLACLGEVGADTEEEPAQLRLRAAEQWASIRVRETAEAQAGTFLALSYLAAAFDLSDIQYQCLVLAMLPRMERGFEDYYNRLDRAGGGALTLGLAMWLLNGAGMAGAQLREELGQDTRLMQYCLESDGRMGLAQSLFPAERIETFALNRRWDDPGREGLELRQSTQEEIPEKIADLSEQMRSYLARNVREKTTFLLVGQPGAGRRTLALSLAQRMDSPLLLVDARKLLGDGGARLYRDAVRECMLQRCPTCVFGLEDPGEQVSPSPEDEGLLCRLLQQTAEIAGCSMLLSEVEWIPDRPAENWRMMPVELRMPSLEESGALWAGMLAQYPVEPGMDPDELAGKYRFTPGRIRQAMSSASARASWLGREKIDRECLEYGCRSQLRHALGEKARKVERLFSWEDLILPPASKQLLRSACDQIKYRRRVYEDWGFGGKLPYGRGLSMLFSGPPGTGKTMAAQIAAGELGLELYKVELPAVVSKYVGETEKNLDRIFKEASRSQAVLFFDEADVLFGKRTEVRDAHDKYNNMEAAYLLQKMEEYSGVSVLATNFLQNFDEAFKRRIRFVIEFPFPNAADRMLLWRSVFPARTPIEEDVDWEYLANGFELSGSAIKNVAVNAAFLAAGEGVAVGMPHLLTALRREMHKSGKSLSRQDLGEYYMLAQWGWEDAGI